MPKKSLEEQAVDLANSLNISLEPDAEAKAERTEWDNKRIVKQKLLFIGQSLSTAILITPTGKAREALTDINILRMDLEKKLEELW